MGIDDLRHLAGSDVVGNRSHKDWPLSSEKNVISKDIRWQQEVSAGNHAMDKGLFFTAHDHYKISLATAKNRLITQKYDDFVPDSLIPAVVVSYLNICDLWKAQEKSAARKGQLCEAFDYLIIQHGTPNIGIGLEQQIYAGLSKIYTEMVLCMQEGVDLKILVEKKQTLMEL